VLIELSPSGNHAIRNKKAGLPIHAGNPAIFGLLIVDWFFQLNR
jgi:hypothetical protein